MTRLCQGFPGHTCDVSLEGEHVLKKRCTSCKVKNDTAVQRARGVRRRVKPRPCQGYRGYQCSESITAGKRCKPCGKIHKHKYDVAFQNRRGQVRSSHYDNATRLALYSKWESCARYWGDENSAREWERKSAEIVQGYSHA